MTQNEPQARPASEADWTAAIVAYGDSRDWKPLPASKALRAFREWCKCPVADPAFHELQIETGFAADRAFRQAYGVLARASVEERAACRTARDVERLGKQQKAEQ